MRSLAVGSKRVRDVVLRFRLRESGTKIATNMLILPPKY